MVDISRDNVVVVTARLGRAGCARSFIARSRTVKFRPAETPPLTRRDVLALGGAAALAAAVPHRAFAQTPSAALPASFAESPDLAALVESGDLPPVAERLPVNPLVVTPMEQVGTYGGTWRTAIVGGLDLAWLDRTVGYDYLVRWDPAWESVIPNIAESWESSDDARTYTFTLREGHKWSDGEPFTVDDILFYAEDVYGNAQLTTSPGANPFSVEKLDDLRFTITFEQPNGLFIQNLATTNGGTIWTRYPKHYLQQFHEKYNTTNLDQLVADAGVANWVELFQDKSSAVPGTASDARFQNLDLPTLYAWKLVEPYGTGVRVRVERNPWYFKVDPDGNQLPYINDVIFNEVQSSEVLLLQAMNGEIDMHVRHINLDVNKPVLAAERENGNYEFFDTVQAIMNHAVVSLNLTHQDPAKREVFQNKDVRIGLSHAINRQEILDAVFVSQGEPWQAAPRQDTPFYSETLAKQYTEYNVDLANEYLDKALPERDGDGWRLRPDGETLTIIVEVPSDGASAPVDTMNLVVGYWQAVGINAQLKPEDRSLFDTRRNANQHDCVVWQGAGGLDVILNPPYYLPFSTRSDYAIPWALWYRQPSNPEAEPEEPPEAAQRQMELYDQINATSDPAEQEGLMKEILAIAEEEFYCMGLVLPGPGYGIVKNTMHNVPAAMPDAFLYPTPGPTNPEQYYQDQ
jgi:peptide/nickel transport system substrate-binding protein